MKYFFYLIAFVTFLISCNNSNKKISEVTGVYRSDNYNVVIIKPFGEGLQLVTFDYPKEEQLINRNLKSAIFQDGLIKVQEDGNYTIPIQNGEIIFQNKKYKKISSFENDSDPQNDKDFFKSIVEAVECNSPELLERFILSKNNTEAEIDCSRNFGAYTEYQVYGRFKEDKETYKGILYAEHKLLRYDLSDTLNIKNNKNCLENFEFIGKLAIKCTSPTGDKYIKIDRVAKSKTGKYYILDSDYSFNYFTKNGYDDFEKRKMFW